MSTLKIGYAARQYPEVRNIIGCVEGARYHLCRDYFSLLRRVSPMLGADPSSDRFFDQQFQFRDFGLNRVDCLHLFNGINYSRTPWVTTYETLIPRFRHVLTNHTSDTERVRSSEATKRALSLLAADQCKGLIALSNSARQIQGRFLGHFPEFKDHIESKTLVLHPPQKPLVDADGELTFPHETDGKITFMLVGHHFFRKGGEEIVDALAEVRRRGHTDLRLVIVSRLQPDAYASSSDAEDVARIRAVIAENGEWIEHHEALSPESVLEKMRTCDVGLLPSYAETYGYSVLEFQACGRPVITTNVRAFPEINSDDRGWLIPVNKQETGGEAWFKSDHDRAVLSAAIKAGLINVFEEILANPQQIREKGARALSHILSHHNHKQFGESLEALYRQA
ncbi:MULTISPECIES: glycosyltransferase family 4 protein [Marinobacter]|uniref:glycosyltransferase family 4 protein n=1 Tax=Marinobacter TaxID=2742 RepID=UPI0017865453|nr:MULTISPECIES: glycosyltransferase family 4 protein [Marinobacter]MBL3556708.1 glycosyltransferase family 4 protein [Marinobacter sp. JB05H06]